MNRKPLNKRTIQKYLEFLIDLKQSIEIDPTVKTSLIAKHHKIGNQIVSLMKQYRIIETSKSGLKWVGKEPSVQMVKSILDAVHAYKYELKIRKASSEYQKKVSKNKFYGKKDPDLFCKKYEEQQIFDQSTASDVVDMIETGIEVGNHIESKHGFWNWLKKLLKISAVFLVVFASSCGSDKPEQDPAINGQILHNIDRMNELLDECDAMQPDIKYNIDMYSIEGETFYLDQYNRLQNEVNSKLNEVEKLEKQTKKLKKQL
jgi:hypothetical protein